MCSFRDNKFVIAIIISVVSFILSVISIAKIYPRIHFDIDYTGALIAVLSLLVTLLVGWQIFYAINYKEKINNITEDFRSKINENELKTNQTRGMCFNMCSKILYEKEDYIHAYEYCLYSIRNYVFGNTKLSNIENILNTMEASLNNMSTCSEFESEEMFYTCLHEIKESILDKEIIERLIDLEKKRLTLKQQSVQLQS